MENAFKSEKLNKYVQCSILCTVQFLLHITTLALFSVHSISFKYVHGWLMLGGVFNRLWKISKPSACSFSISRRQVTLVSFIEKQKLYLLRLLPPFPALPSVTRISVLLPPSPCLCWQESLWLKPAPFQPPLLGSPRREGRLRWWIVEPPVPELSSWAPPNGFAWHWGPPVLQRRLPLVQRDRPTCSAW